MKVLKAEKLKKEFGSTIALFPSSFEVEEGEFLAILGPSGCGKTTILRMICGILPPSDGAIILNDRDITNLAPEKRGIGIVFQTYALFPHMTVRNNILFGLKMNKIDKEEQKRRLDYVSGITNLGEYLDRFPKQLSGGQQQRVALARALVLEPSIILLDEPLSNLDAKLRVMLREDLLKLHKSANMTSIYVTHDQAEAMAMADRVIVMNFGKIVEVGKPENLYRNPKHLFTAKFLGQTNIVKIKGEGDRGRLPWGQYVKTKTEFKTVESVSIRPEDIEILNDLKEYKKGRIVLKTFMGSSIEYLVEIEDVQYRVTTSGSKEKIYETGDEVYLKYSGLLQPLVDSGDVSDYE